MQVQAFATALEKNSTLDGLALRGFRFGDQGAQARVLTNDSLTTNPLPMTSDNPRPKRIFCEACANIAGMSGLHMATCQALAAALKTNSTLKELDLEDDDIGTAGSKA